MIFTYIIETNFTFIFKEKNKSVLFFNWGENFENIFVNKIGSEIDKLSKLG